MNIGIITGASSGMGKEFVKLTMQNHLELDMGDCQKKGTSGSLVRSL